MTSLVFSLPDDSNVIASVIRSVPDSWSWVDGTLSVPKPLVSEDLAMPDTGYLLSRFRNVRAEVVGRTLGELGVAYDKPPDLFGFLVERKRPAWVKFDEAGYDNSHDLTLATAKRLAGGFVHLGYRGILRFFSDCRHNNKFHNPARLYLEMAAGDCLVGEGYSARGLILISWEEAYGGSQADIQVPLDLCRSLELKDAADVPR